MEFLALAFTVRQPFTALRLVLQSLVKVIVVEGGGRIPPLSLHQ
jgi:hypothetical protein